MRIRINRQALVRVSRGPTASVASQAAGLLQVGLLLLHGGATSATDTYFYLFVLGLTPTQILIVGVMYPALLNSHSMTHRQLSWIRRTTPALAAVSVAMAFVWLSVNREFEDTLLAVAIMMSINAAIQSLLHYRASAAAAGGDSVWISGIALPANLAGSIILAYPWNSSAAATAAMVGASATGNCISLWYFSRRRVGQEVLNAVVSCDQPSTRGSLWHLGRSSVGYTSHVVLSSLAVTLPESGVTVLSLANRIVGAIATTLTNAVMPVLVHQSTNTATDAWRFLRLLLTCLAVIGGAVTALTAVLDRQHVAIAAIISLWTIASSAAAVVQRLSFRFLPARTAGASMMAGLLLISITVGVSSTPYFNVLVLLCAYAALDLSTAGLLLWRLKNRAAAVGALLALLVVVFSNLIAAC